MIASPQPEHNLSRIAKSLLRLGFSHNLAARCPGLIASLDVARIAPTETSHRATDPAAKDRELMQPIRLINNGVLHTKVILTSELVRKWPLWSPGRASKCNSPSWSIAKRGGVGYANQPEPLGGETRYNFTGWSVTSYFAPGELIGVLCIGPPFRYAAQGAMTLTHPCGVDFRTSSSVRAWERLSLSQNSPARSIGHFHFTGEFKLKVRQYRYVLPDGTLAATLKKDKASHQW